jgi:hypothetical protein
MQWPRQPSEYAYQLVLTLESGSRLFPSESYEVPLATDVVERSHRHPFQRCFQNVPEFPITYVGVNPALILTPFAASLEDVVDRRGRTTIGEWSPARGHARHRASPEIRIPFALT